MTTRLVDSRWWPEIKKALRADPSELRIISPFIKEGVLSRLLEQGPRSVSVITRFDLWDFAQGVSDVAALRRVLGHGGKVRGIKNLHAKMYLFGSRRAIVTSANLTAAALDRNLEFGLVSEDPEIIAACRRYFDELWQRGGSDLVISQLDEWNHTLNCHWSVGGRLKRPAGLNDFGADAGIEGPSPYLPALAADVPQAFVKFLGEWNDRSSLHTPTIEQIKSAGCHWALPYPAKKRPRAVKDGALMFIARTTRDPNDIRVFGHAIGMRHEPGRDDATAEDILKRDWKAQWPRYIRVHSAQFVAGTLGNGVSLNELMSALDTKSFASTKRNAARGQGNTYPRHAYSQQPAVELSAEGTAWLSERLQAAFDRYGKVPQEQLDKLDWPSVPGLTPKSTGRP